MIKIFFLCLGSIFVFLICLNVNVFSQDKTSKDRTEIIKSPQDTANPENDYYKAEHIRYKDFIYKNNIKTVLLRKPDFELSVPMLDLNSTDQLKLSFDDLDGDLKSYKFSFIHCDAYWLPSDILPYQFEKGFEEDFIIDYSYSLNTTQRYTHYNLLFPTDNMKIIESGNYILKVFVEGNPDDIVFTKRFMVIDAKVTIDGIVKQATYVEDMDFKQEIDFTINYSNYDIPHPFTDLKTVIQQNGRWDNTLNDLKPRMIQNNLLIYDYQKENTFNGGNEFRFFDIKTLHSNTERVSKIVTDNNKFFQINLLPDQSRSVKNYANYKDINGRLLIKSEDNVIRSSDVEADYVNVHFTLPYKYPFVDGSVYIMGALTNWDFTKEGKMIYNYTNNVYEATLFLKQGYYNYQYVFLENGKKTGDETLFEGNHWETENDYIIYVYNREQGSTYDKLIGVKALNSAVAPK